MVGCNGEGIFVNSFALVSYLPQPLATFVDRLRHELVHDCAAKAHVTVLPPRPLLSPPEEAWCQIHEAIQDFQPFELRLGEVEIFQMTQVVYLSVAGGFRQLIRLHDALNKGRVSFAEPFPFHPHLTLAQELDAHRVAEAAEIAARRWSKFRGSRSYVADRLTFVQNTLDNRWTDLFSVPLSNGVRAR